MFEEMRIGAMLQKLNDDNAAALPCHDILEMATVGGASALGMSDSIGVIESGKQADVILVDLDQPHLWPLFVGRYENIVEQLVYSANAADVTHTIVDGKVLMSDREILTLDHVETRKAVEEVSRELLSKAGMNKTKPAILE
jgi:5-methylthioadenosine/S-adenosylhomocysteine deaminase